ncbi:hypothetical protein EDI_251230 [Entamoeba dispar SAW760]|uniref:Chaperone DnaJ C-terminal domain-containing protein n=1 Tax=Entamoeba dispar (strain ATCC PRA-260 / SAW760) TaxID=370354 RepID=B0E6U6_ENTDS|nr:uncharacterized protein EDI_251230 [Entamoeba dispar SAW760]EDR29687.1 hypothetical protein EDI_251230 [Entamoeba dispar SAW760]|eukprot:EDR29687.1 hypothetical protein EDI_251230 [Entamoeba dispar SAW760]
MQSNIISPTIINELLLEVSALKELLPSNLKKIVTEINDFGREVNNCKPPDFPCSTSVGSILYRYCIGIGTLIIISQNYLNCHLKDEIESLLSSSSPNIKDIELYHTELPNQSYDLMISFQEGFNGCNKRIIKGDHIYNIVIPRYTLHPTSLSVGDVVFNITVSQQSNYCVFDDILFVTVHPTFNNPFIIVELPDGSSHKIAAKHIEQLGSVDIEGYPFRIAAVFQSPKQLLSSALSGSLQQHTGKSAVLRNWDVSLFKTSSLLKQSLVEKILMTFNVQKTDRIESFEIAEDTASVALKYIDHSSAVTLRHALKYPNQTYVIPPLTSNKSIFISTLTPTNVIRGEICATLPVLCEGGIAENEHLHIKVEIPRGTLAGSTVIKKEQGKTYVLQVNEIPSGYYRSGDDIITSVELPEFGAKAANQEITIFTLNRTAVNLHGNLSKVMRIVGGGVPLNNGYGDLVVTFIPKAQVLKEKEYYQIAKYCTKFTIFHQDYIMREKRFNDGSIIPKIYRIPKNLNVTLKKRNYFVRFPLDGDVKNGRPTDLIFEVIPKE